MRRILPWILLLLASSWSYAQDVKNEDLDARFESIHDSLRRTVEPTVVSIFVDREEETPETPRRTRPGLSILDGGVFKNRPNGSPVSGTILEADGLIVTTYFNVKGPVRSIQVTLSNGRELPAEIKGFNAAYDLALLKIDTADLPTLRKASTKNLRTGQWVFAFGRAPDKKEVTLNPGIVSAPWRLAGKGIQIDSRMNYGNVGGPIVNRAGEMIGITCKVDTKYSGSYGQNSGIGFAVTWDEIQKILPDLKQGKNVAESRRPFLGIQADDTSEVVGVKIREVIPAGAADKAGIKTGDILVEFDGKKLENFDQLRDAISGKAPGDSVDIVLHRGKEVLKMTLLLGWTPGE